MPSRASREGRRGGSQYRAPRAPVSGGGGIAGTYQRKRTVRRARRGDVNARRAIQGKRAVTGPGSRRRPPAPTPTTTKRTNKAFTRPLTRAGKLATTTRKEATGAVVPLRDRHGNLIEGPKGRARRVNLKVLSRAEEARQIEEDKHAGLQVGPVHLSPLDIGLLGVPGAGLVGGGGKLIGTKAAKAAGEAVARKISAKKATEEVAERVAKPKPPGSEAIARQHGYEFKEPGRPESGFKQTRAREEAGLKPGQKLRVTRVPGKKTNARAPSEVKAAREKAARKPYIGASKQPKLEETAIRPTRINRAKGTPRRVARSARAEAQALKTAEGQRALPGKLLRTYGRGLREHKVATPVATLATAACVVREHNVLT